MVESYQNSPVHRVGRLLYLAVQVISAFESRCICVFVELKSVSA